MHFFTTPFHTRSLNIALWDYFSVSNQLCNGSGDTIEPQHQIIQDALSDFTDRRYHDLSSSHLIK